MRIPSPFLVAISLVIATPAYPAQWELAETAIKSGDYETALRELTVLAEAGDPRAQMELGNLHYAGNGVEQDYAEAMRWYQMAADQGFPSGQFGVGLMYKYGWGVEKDQETAAEWLTLAAQNGNVNAQKWLGDAYYKGEGVPQDYGQALDWYMHIAASSESLNSVVQFTVAEMYRDAKGTLPDYRSAYMWFSLSAFNGFEPAAEKRDMLATRMTPQDVSAAQVMARECLDSEYQTCG